MQRDSRFANWIRAAAAMVLAAIVIWLAWPRIVGIPAWLAFLGLLQWLRALDPLDRWVTALATILAVAVALFGERIRALLFPVRLDVEARPSVSIPYADGVVHSAKHIRLSVLCKGSSAARIVEVFVADIWEDGRKNHAWSPSALSWTDVNQARMEVISGGTRRLCDFLMFLQPGPAVPAWASKAGSYTRDELVKIDLRSTACALVMLKAMPNGGLNLLPPRRYVFRLEISAVNARPAGRFFELKFDGNWDAEPTVRETRSPA